MSAIGIAWKPVRTIPAAMLVALVASAIGGRHARLATWAVVAASIAWVVGMSLAVATDNDLY